MTRNQRKPIAGYHQLPLADKERATRLTAAAPLWRCRLCGVKVLGRDQLGHSARAHAGVSHGWDLVTG